MVQNEAMERSNDSTIAPRSNGAIKKGPVEFREKELDPPWQDYPFNLSTYNPFTEWGEHYQQIFAKDIWPDQSSFVLQDMNGSTLSQ